MSKKQQVDLSISILIFVSSMFFLLFPLLSYTNLKVSFCAFMGILSVFSLIRFCLTRKSKDYYGIFTMLISILTMLIAILLPIEISPKHLAFTLMIWTIGMSLVLLKKGDYYHDRRNRLWKLRVCFLFAFVIIGFLTSMNLYYTNEVQMLLLGYYFMFYSLLECLDPFVAYLVGRKAK